jgi:hypothetical protein
VAVFAILLTFGSPFHVDAASADGEVFRSGYAGCDLIAITNDFELEPGEVFEFTVDKTERSYIELTEPGYLMFSAVNTGRKSVKIRLQAQSGL